jgi:murein L,D-transpeptidase YcbB/YkuD
MSAGIHVRRVLFRAGIAALASLGLAGHAGAGDAAREIELRLAAPVMPLWLAADARAGSQWTALRHFYEQRAFAPAWLDETGLRPQARELTEAVHDAARLGLDPQRHTPAPGVLAAFDDLPEWPTALAERDLQLSYAFLRLAQELLEGRLSPRGASAYWPASPAAEADGSRLLAAGASEDGPRAALASLAPEHPQYEALLRALEEHRAIAAAGGWPAVPPSPAPKRGRPDPRLTVLRQRLAMSGDASLKRFQARHGLTPDGRLTENTLAALNVPVEERIAQIELNLERWRWLPRRLGPRYVMVNVAAFELHAVREGGATERMKIAAGRAGETPTPIFDAEMRTVVFSPWWNVPPRIAEEEIAPAARRNRAYLRRRGLQAASAGGGVQYRQPPGPRNPMGLVKFLLPNPFNVYLHDTPEDALFARARRDFSHGCMRVERPLALARWALQDEPAWTEARIRAAMRAGTERGVALPVPIPVHVAYFSVWVEGDGAVRFLPDVYGHDEAQLALMRGEGPWKRVAAAAGAMPAAP